MCGSGCSGSWRGSWGLDGVGSGEGRVAGTCEYGKESSGSIKCGEFLGELRRMVSLSRGTLLHGVSK
jgi:hypothetical protein